MASRRSRPRRLLLPTLLAAVLAAEITGIALARSMTPDAAPVTMTPSVPAAASAPSLAVPVAVPMVAIAGGDSGQAAHAGLRRAPGAAGIAPAAARPTKRSTTHRATTHRAVVHRAVVHRATTHHAAVHRVTVTRNAGPAYRGVNHVWIPSLGINQGIQSFPCSRSRPPDAGVYRWGCAGANNVYLLAHAWSSFKPLHDAFVGGRLRTGMKVVYADGSGHVHTYSVIWWKVVAPTTAASWAWAPLSHPGMTLQTCVGANSAYRLMVRLTEVA